MIWIFIQKKNWIPHSSRFFAERCRTILFIHAHSRIRFVFDRNLTCTKLGNPTSDCVINSKETENWSAPCVFLRNRIYRPTSWTTIQFVCFKYFWVEKWFIFHHHRHDYLNSVEYILIYRRTKLCVNQTENVNRIKEPPIYFINYLTNQHFYSISANETITLIFKIRRWFKDWKTTI